MFSQILKYLFGLLNFNSFFSAKQRSKSNINPSFAGLKNKKLLEQFVGINSIGKWGPSLNLNEKQLFGYIKRKRIVFIRDG